MKKNKEIISRNAMLLRAAGYINRESSGFLDGRDLDRLVRFLSVEECAKFGVELTDEAKVSHVAEEWNSENVLKQLGSDVEFAFRKALDQRSISASLMVNVLRMWALLLDVEHVLKNVDYPMYGLPIIKAMANHFGFEDQIPQDRGDESKFNDE